MIKQCVSRNLPWRAGFFSSRRASARHVGCARHLFQVGLWHWRWVEWPECDANVRIHAGQSVSADHASVERMASVGLFSKPLPNNLMSLNEVLLGVIKAHHEESPGLHRY